MSFTKNKIWFTLLPIVIIVAGVIGYFVNGFSQDIDFAGGTAIELNVGAALNDSQRDTLIEKFIAGAEEYGAAFNVKPTVQLTGTGNTHALLKTSAELSNDQRIAAENAVYTWLIEEKITTDETLAQTAADEQAAPEAGTDENSDALAAIEGLTGANLGTESTATSQQTASDTEGTVEPISEIELSYELQSASYGDEMKTKTLAFSLLAVLLMLIYVSIRFEWRSGIMAVSCLAINVLVMMSVYAIAKIPLSTRFIAAILTVLGYSINDTIVIFDRIRENLKYASKKGNVSDVVEKSIHESLTRTINTSVTTLITLVLLYFMGSSTLKDFALPIIIGVVCGSYTSIFVASPWWGAWKDAGKASK